MGRHQKRNSFSSSSRIALAGVAIIGATALAPTAAQAAPDSDWDRLAQCESGGNWAIDTGNGYQGGLQFSPSTWSGYGGGEFAPTANRASREQQIVVAERVLAGQGWGAWPSCSSQLGLNSAPTQRTAPGAPAAAPAQQIQRATQQIAQQRDVLAVDAIYNGLEAQAKAQGFVIPQQVADLYKAHRHELNGALTEYNAQVENINEQVENVNDFVAQAGVIR